MDYTCLRQEESVQFFSFHKKICCAIGGRHRHTCLQICKPSTHSTFWQFHAPPTLLPLKTSCCTHYTGPYSIFAGDIGRGQYVYSNCNVVGWQLQATCLHFMLALHGRAVQWELPGSFVAHGKYVHAQHFSVKVIEAKGTITGKFSYLPFFLKTLNKSRTLAFKVLIVVS